MDRHVNDSGSDKDLYSVSTYREMVTTLPARESCTQYVVMCHITRSSVCRSLACNSFEMASGVNENGLTALFQLPHSIKALPSERSQEGVHGDRSEPYKVSIVY